MTLNASPMLFRRIRASAITLFAMTGILGVGSLVFADEASESIRTGLKQAATGASYSTESADFSTIIGNLISTALSFVGVLLLCYLLYAGFLWMTAGGDSKKVESAKTMIQNAIIGLLIIAIAYSASSFVLTQLGGVTSGSNGTSGTPSASTPPAAPTGP